MRRQNYSVSYTSAHYDLLHNFTVCKFTQVYNNNNKFTCLVTYLLTYIYLLTLAARPGASSVQDRRPVVESLARTHATIPRITQSIADQPGSRIDLSALPALTLC